MVDARAGARRATATGWVTSTSWVPPPVLATRACTSRSSSSATDSRARLISISLIRTSDALADQGLSEPMSATSTATTLCSRCLSSRLMRPTVPGTCVSSSAGCAERHPALPVQRLPDEVGGRAIARSARSPSARRSATTAPRATSPTLASHQVMRGLFRVASRHAAEAPLRGAGVSPTGRSSRRSARPSATPSARTRAGFRWAPAPVVAGASAVGGRRVPTTGRPPACTRRRRRARGSRSPGPRRRGARARRRRRRQRRRRRRGDRAAEQRVRRAAVRQDDQHPQWEPSQQSERPQQRQAALDRRALVEACARAVGVG